MIPFYKLGSLLVRTFSRPMATRIKRYTLTNDNGTLKRITKVIFIQMGNKYNGFERFINRKFLTGHVKIDVFVKPLTDEAAIQKGADLFSELIVYFCVLGFPLYEMLRQQRDADAKSKQLKNKIDEIQQSIEEAEQIHKINEQNYDELINQNQQMKKQFETIKYVITDQISNAVSQSDNMKSL